MLLSSSKHFRRHEPDGTKCPTNLVIIFLKEFAYSEVTKIKLTVIIEKNVLRLYVAVRKVLNFVAVVDRRDEMLEQDSNILFFEALLR